MKLTNYEKEMLNGDHGEVRQQAMQVLYDPVSYTHLDVYKRQEPTSYARITRRRRAPRHFQGNAG